MNFKISWKLISCPFNRHIFFLVLLSVAMPISYATWSALINNFVIEIAHFSGVEIGWLHSIREVPGFLAIGVILILFLISEQNLACLALILLGFATGITALLPSFKGLVLTTLLGSIGFHYFETVNQSLQLQWLSKEKAPIIMGLLISVGSFVSLAAYLVIVFGWKPLSFSFNFIYSIAGFLTVIISIIVLIGFKKFKTSKKKKTQFIVRKRY